MQVRHLKCETLEESLLWDVGLLVEAVISACGVAGSYRNSPSAVLEQDVNGLDAVSRKVEDQVEAVRELLGL